MVGSLVTLILLTTLSLVQTLRDPQQISLTVAEHGDNLTLTCAGAEYGMFHWFKISFGYTAERVATGSFDKATLEEHFDKRRFGVTKVGNVFSLTMRNISKEDEAVYFCQAGSSYEISVINYTVLAVNDPKNEQKSVYVKQSPDVDSVLLGDTMNLQCSLFSENQENTDPCPGNRSVYWFRAGSGSFPGIIYTDGISGEEHKDRRCVYRLSKTVRDASDTGTYYCAVVTCGQILFGEGSTVQITSEKFWPVVTVLTLLAVSILVNLSLIVAMIQRKAVCQHCKDTRVELEADGRNTVDTRGVTASKRAEQRAAAHQQSDVDGEMMEINYVALDFSSRKAKKWKNRQESPEDCYTECLYSHMRDYQ